MIDKDVLKSSIIKGVFASAIPLSIYFLVISLISGWPFALDQFSQYMFYILALSGGFGIQFALYSLARGAQVPGQVLAATGATSTSAMISCCAHYLTNLLPILGTAGIVTFISQYQVQFFWVGMLFNLLGIVYIGNRVMKIYRIS